MAEELEFDWDWNLVLTKEEMRELLDWMKVVEVDSRTGLQVRSCGKRELIFLSVYKPGFAPFTKKEIKDLTPVLIDLTRVHYAG